MSVPPEYDDVVDLYIRLISLDSPAAADAIEQIRTTCDARAALRATLAITLIKTEAQRHQPIPDADAYAYLLIDYPQALPLLNQAIEDWLKDRARRVVALGLAPVDGLPKADLEAPIPNADHPPDP